MTRHHIAWAITAPAAVFALMLAAPALAQEQATIVKRDGSRVSGRFEAWNRDTNTFYIRVSQGDQRIVPLGDTAVLDVEGNGDHLPETELGPARGGDHVLVLRTGEVIRGRLLNIEGGEGSGQEGEARVLSFKPADGAERRARFSEVRRLYLGNYPAATTASAGPAPALEDTPVPTGALRVAANAGWVPTGVTVRRVDHVAFATTGQVQLSGDAEDRAGPAGSFAGRFAPGSPLPAALAGALIGRIGNGAPFAIGDQANLLAMPGDGPLFLAVNDDAPGDNQGAFAVTLTVQRGRRR